MNSTVLLIATLSAVGLGIFAVDNSERDVCISLTPETAGQNVGFEVIDFMRREAWVTTDWTVDAYAAFSPGITAPHWIKNDPRQGYAARAVVLRSPGCPNDGEFTYQTMFGRTFFHIADMTRIRGKGLSGGPFAEGGVFKHHRLEFDADQTVSFLVSPEGESFVRVNSPIDAPEGENTLPEGWTLQDIRLDSAWNADLIGETRVIRLPDESSYQGPIEDLPQALYSQFKITPQESG
ncbi:MAG: hypothetical protein AAFR73_00855 [Pseudomonadota bacterium]